MKQKKTILLIDDDSAILGLMTIRLELDGFRVATAQNGADGLQVLADQEIDVVLCDLMMPIMDGLVFLRTLREQRKNSTPVIMLTSVASNQDEITLLDAGASKVLFKPVDIAEILQNIDQVTQN